MLELSLSTLSAAFPDVRALNVSWGAFHTLGSFKTLKRLHTLDLSGSPALVHDSDVFSGLQELSEVHTDNYKLCCHQILPDTMNLQRCYSPVDEVSSCDNLLRSAPYRVFLWLFALVAVLGNGFSFAFRVFKLKNAANTGNDPKMDVCSG